MEKEQLVDLSEVEIDNSLNSGKNSQFYRKSRKSVCLSSR